MPITSRFWKQSVRLANDRRLRLIAVLGMLGLMWACYPVTDTSYSHPQNAGTGQWLIEFRTGEEKIRIELRYARHDAKGDHTSSHGFSLDRARLTGLSRDQAMSGGSHVQFQLQRDAGTFNFDGWFKEGNGSAHFTFAPNRSFASDLKTQGIGEPTDEQLLSLAMTDTGFALINELKAQSYGQPTLNQLVNLGNHGVNLDYVQGLKSYGYPVKTIDNLIKMTEPGGNLKF